MLSNCIAVLRVLFFQIFLFRIHQKSLGPDLNINKPRIHNSDLFLFSLDSTGKESPETTAAPQSSTSETSSSKNLGRLYMQEKIPIGKM
jgi:hypothetical protein